MKLLRISALAVVLAGTALAGGCTMDRDSDHDMSYRGDHASGAAFDYSTVRYGYSDGYWDNGHQWHAWNSDADMQGYRSRSGAVYHDWHHDRDGKDGWQND